jgi:hypothetical protein
MIDTKTIRSTTPPKDNSTPSCEEFIEMIARKQKENQDIPAPTPWEINVGNRLLELGEAIVAHGKIKNEWHRELYSICDFITYMEMNDIS